MKKKKAKSTSRAPILKRKGPAKTVDEYLSRVPEPLRSTLARIRATIRSVAPDATETISYGIPAFRLNGMLAWFAAFSNHCSLFPGASVIESFKDELRGFTTSKGTIRFTADNPIPAALVKKLVQARIAQMKKKAQWKTRT